MRGGYLYVHYGYGAASIPMPAPVRYRVDPGQRWWYCHPSLAGLLGSLVIISLLRSCATPVVKPGRTLVWLRQPPQAVTREAIRTTAHAPERVEKKPRPPVITAKAKPSRPHLVMRRSVLKIEAAPLSASIAAKQGKNARRTFMAEKPKFDESIALKGPEPLPVKSRGPVLNPGADMIHKTDEKPALPQPDNIESLSFSRNREGRTMRDPLIGLSDAVTATPAEEPIARLSSSKERAAVPSILPGPPVKRVGEAVLPPEGEGEKVERYQGRFARGGDLIAKGGRDLTVEGPAASMDLEQGKAPSEELVDPERMVTINGAIDGQAARVRYLKQAIYKKVMTMGPEDSPYCCRVGDVNCVITVASAGRVSLSFLKRGVLMNIIPFDVASKLERILPQGAVRCEGR